MATTRPVWYVDSKKIKPKEYHSWTKQEISSVYTMRLGGESVDGIIAKLHLQVNRTRVYNVLRLAKKKLQQRCHQCGHKLKKSEIFEQLNVTYPRCKTCCEENSQYKQKKWRSNIKKHLCGYCGKNHVIPGHKSCKMCLSATHRRRYVMGLCGKCGKSPISKRSKALCDLCLEGNRVSSAAYRTQQAIA